MTDSAPNEQIGRQLAFKSPWMLIAILLHVVVIAVASVLYYAHGHRKDDEDRTQIALAPPPAPTQEIKPPQIIERQTVPKLNDLDVTFDEVTTAFDPDAGENNGEPTDPDSTSELANLPSGGTTGGSAIGVNGPGHFSIAPSTQGGRHLGGGKKYRIRFGDHIGPGGPGPRVNDAIISGLEWLRRHQDEDGKWDTDGFMKHDEGEPPCTGKGNGVNDVGITGLALLAFLGEGNTLREGTYRRVVRSGIKWLVEQQQENGLIGESASQQYMYSHAIATLALCEAYGLSEHRPLKGKAQAAINYIAQARNPYGVWRYTPRGGDNDTSVTGWMVQALLSAKEFGLEVDDAALKTARVWFESVTDPGTGAAGYTKAGEGSSRPVGKVDKFPAEKSESLTAVVLLCRYLMHDDPSEVKTMGLAADTIAKMPPTWNDTDGSIDMYYWYYGSYAMFQAGGKHWDNWSRKMTDAVLKTQKTAGNPKGSWDPVDPWGEEGGRVYSTAIMVLCLEAYYRYGRVLGAR